MSFWLNSLTPTVVVAACALLFAVGSFWWLNARRGKLRSFEPYSFAAFNQPELVLLRIPLVLHNTGAAPLVVQNLRLRIPGAGLTLPLPWRSSRTRVDPRQGEETQLPAVFAIPGRTAEVRLIEFGAPLPGFVLATREYRAVIDVKLGHRKQWSTLVAFALRAENVTAKDSYIAYSNAPHDVSKEGLANAQAKLEDALKRQSQSPPETIP
ncbi:hypothetical protein SAMN05661093_03646 [Kibdelosporangium aridum]|uniref:Uncharacterized protein n=1 Tax=Kibdelosporangium aridum TaxID=2030 RepID=A0A1W2DP51_KIBAR|nr:hypothetical protein SAMN05661093_03646 [Kibdelosporangium aridum]